VHPILLIKFLGLPSKIPLWTFPLGLFDLLFESEKQTYE
jgi:hypothetical protein